MYLKYAQCLEVTCGENEKLAMDAYRMLLSLFPENTAARIALAALLDKDGQHDEAMVVLGGRVDGGQTTDDSLMDLVGVVYGCE